MNAYGIAEQLLQTHSCIPRLCDHLHPDVHLQSPVLSLVTLWLLKFKRFDFFGCFLCIIRIHISISVSYSWWCPPFIRTHRINIHKHINISKKSKSLQILFWFINKSYLCHLIHFLKCFYTIQGFRGNWSLSQLNKSWNCSYFKWILQFYVDHFVTAFYIVHYTFIPSHVYNIFLIKIEYSDWCLAVRQSRLHCIAACNMQFYSVLLVHLCEK